MQFFHIEFGKNSAPKCPPYKNRFSEGSGHHNRQQGALADWSFHSKFWYPHVHGASHNYICCRDLASKVLRRLRFQDTSDSAGWRDTRISTEQFLAAIWLRGNYNPMFDVPGWCLSLLRCDIMHSLHLGLFLVSGAEMIWSLIQLGHFGPVELVMHVRLGSAFASLVSFCKEKRLTLNLRSFKLSTLGNPETHGYAELHCKAHDSKIIASAYVASCSLMHTCATQHSHRHMIALLCVHLEVWAAPGAPETVPLGGGLRPPPIRKGLRGPRGRPYHQNGRFPILNGDLPKINGFMGPNGSVNTFYPRSSEHVAVCVPIARGCVSL
jgi:hypothetical protein